MPLHKPQECGISRRELLTRVLPASLLAGILASCGDDVPPSTPQKREFRSLDKVDPVAKIESKALKPEIPPVPNNRFISPPPATLSGKAEFLKEVEKITMEDRK